MNVINGKIILLDDMNDICFMMVGNETSTKNDLDSRINQNVIGV